MNPRSTLLPEEKKESEGGTPLIDDACELEWQERQRSGSLGDPDPVYDNDQMRFPFEHYPPIDVNQEKL